MAFASFAEPFPGERSGSAFFSGLDWVHHCGCLEGEEAEAWEVGLSELEEFQVVPHQALDRFQAVSLPHQSPRRKVPARANDPSSQKQNLDLRLNAWNLYLWEIPVQTFRHRRRFPGGSC